ncbi:ComEC/Rec2 family competence protein [Paraurantiacibacter namhicola]|uniref:ComEC family competence protein n=1 Tax=Paraurantiacibacter namhicola TaxID=645517 RepID=A0A1C7D9G6_9SPHN|nr:ComEC/Rec2 family competence protein [Paraurantiacibacter namhicola]ANU08075.1 ComEC family competence protein [Paraurantiacibacter namhicola]
MATRVPPLVPMGEGDGDVALQHTPWRMRAALSSIADTLEGALGRAGFDKGPWLVVAFAAGIASWFTLPGPASWIASMAAAGFLVLGALAAWRGREDRDALLRACMAVGLVFAIGLALAWARSATVGQPALERPVFGTFEGTVLERIEQPSQERVRLVMATRSPEDGSAIKVRVNVPLENDRADLTEGAVVRLRARLMPPAAPMLPGGYDFARTAWFQGYAATGSALGEVEVLEGAERGSLIGSLQRRLSGHVRDNLGGSAGSIAAAFASGDRGAISSVDEEAMRDAGLTHLLSISGLHVSAVIAAAYMLAIRLLALWPWLVLRVRLPVLAAGIAALAGIGYTLLTGAQVPTVRSCVGAVLVLIALALGREPLSLRMVAVAAAFVLLLWPETLVGPSFQMSFSAVIAIVALHNSAPVRAFLRPREEGWLRRTGRGAFMLLVTGMVIEIALMPIVLFHFHRAGVYGALANVVAIPLVTFLSMPLIALALFLDLFGLGAPAWWLAGQTLDLLLGIAHTVSAQPGAVKLMPHMGNAAFALFVAGGLWLALWRGRARLLGFVPAAVATAMMIATPVPDLLVSGDGRHVGITGEDERLLVLRDSRSSYARGNLMELAGVQGEAVPLADWPGARCSPDFCVIGVERDGRTWQVLISRSRELIAERDLAAACERSDIVISERWLPRTCEPRVLKADMRMLSESGGLAIVLDGEDARVTTVAQSQGEHGWWGDRGRR